MTWMAPAPTTDTTQLAHWVEPGRAASRELGGSPAVCGTPVTALKGMDSEFGPTPRPVCEECAAAASDPYAGGYARSGRQQ